MIDLYKDFVVARHNAALARHGEPYTESEDPVTRSVVASYRFTNVFRIADWGSQYVVKSLIGEREKHDILASLILYRLTNTTPPWEFYELMQGRPPGYEEIVSGVALDVFRESWARPMFGTAYATHVGVESKGANKLEFFLNLATYATPAFTEEFHNGSPAERYKLLNTIPRIGKFLAMQIITDYGYNGDDCEDTYIVPGPGAERGAKLIDPDKNATKLIEELRDMWRDEPNVPRLPNGLPPSLMDVQNTLCEFQKFERYYYGGKGTSFKVRHPKLPPLTLPENWRIQK